MRTKLRADEEVTTAVIRAVADREGRDPIDMPPLYDAVDVEALDRLLREDGSAFVGTVSFRYADSQVVVHRDGETAVFATPAGDPVID